MKSKNQKEKEKKQEKIEMQILTVIVIILIVWFIYQCFNWATPGYDNYPGKWFYERSK